MSSPIPVVTAFAADLSSFKKKIAAEDSEHLWALFMKTPDDIRLGLKFVEYSSFVAAAQVAADACAELLNSIVSHWAGRLNVLSQSLLSKIPDYHEYVVKVFNQDKVSGNPIPH